MANDFLGQILGSVLGRGGGVPPGAMGGGSNMAGGLGDLLGGILGGGRGPAGGLGGLGGLGSLGANIGLGSRSGAHPGSGMGSQGAALTALLIPLAMQWVQRNGGIGAVLERFRQKGYSQQAASWVSTGDNEALAPQAIDDVVGRDELSRLSQQLGVGQEEVASGMAQVLPEVVNHLTPQGEVPPDADDTLNSGLSVFDQLLGQGQGQKPDPER